MPRSYSRRIRILTLALSIAGAGAACDPAANALPTTLPAVGASADAGNDASGTGDPSGALPSGAITDPAVAWPAFASCLRAHGANVADPEVDANGDPHWGDDLKQSITDQIRAGCEGIIAAVDEGGTLKGGRVRPVYSYESELAQAACMRTHGLPTWPDPDPDSAGSMPEGFDKEDQTVLSALIACESLLVESTASPSPGL
jgi:hypothetical protein